eukprot:CAMPEP_0201866530 /NCGR_PEP_ID=MMETSP0902-20130614/1084_1 /ASSEMBLY_ACC=CAM_ASM_000551 /TAXON_ID=420261 /ORGANISM="Thalassiosira antarctica, Strain CCMP982" /LENGTH=748 /DNA_ID=CAMNT_0048391519 /DNA_START=56 /DNA_END=2302 /DNA_ORIENTATION=-
MSPANSGPPHPPPPKTVNNNTAINEEPTKNYDATSEKLETGLEDLLLGPQMHPTFDVFYTLQKKLQGGSYGTVFVGVHNLNEREYAVKVVDRRKLSQHDDDAQLQEVDILRSLNPNSFKQPKCGNKNNDHSQQDNGIINIIDFYPSPTKYHIVMELARGGDVFDRLAKRKVYTEKHARDLARRMLESIQFLHERGIAHRDIKPENLLLMDENSDVQLKLADFGFARRFDLNDPDASMKTKCGTPAFVPPELVLGRRYGPKCDVWSAGCTLFMLLSGRAPFNAKKAGKNAMFRAIRAGDFVFYDDYWGPISMSAKKLVLNMLHVDPNVRMTAKEALETEWMTSKDEDLRRISLNKSLAEIISFSARRKLKGAIGAVMYAVGGKFWNIDTAAIWREDMHSERAVGGDCDKDKESGIDLPPTFENLYHLDSKLQEGVSATVWQGTSVKTEKTYAIKVIEREDLSQSEDASVLNEVSILKSLRHKHIVPLLDFFETPECFYLVMRKCDGGDVLDRVASIEQYSEKDACQLSLGLLQAVQFMHERGIAHRDLKPQNLLLESNDDNTSVKVCDFGYAKRVHVPQSLTTLCGSLHYVAPELLKNHPYDESADMWSVGVIIYFLLAGYLPFHHKDQNELFKIIRRGKFSFDSKHWAGVSEEAIGLIVHLLEVDPSTRYTATQALQLDWIKSVEESILAEHDLANSLTGLRKSNRLKNLARSVQWLNKEKLLSSLTVDTVGLGSTSSAVGLGSTSSA